MKKVLPVVTVLLILCGSVFATRLQKTGVRIGPTEDIVDSVPPKNEDKKAAANSEAKNTRKETSKNEKESEKQKTPPAPSSTASAPVPAETNPAPVMSDAPPKQSATPLLRRETSEGKTGNTSAKPDTTPATNATPGNSTNTAATKPSVTSSSAPLTSIYRVGIGDVLDIRLLNQPTHQSTLYTVMAGGLLEYPLIGEPVPVEGKTTDEISAFLAAELKRRAVYEKPQVVVNVREYVSHTVLVSGLVDHPGAKLLRREAVPLYVVLAEASPRADAGMAVVISRATGQSNTVDLADPVAVNMLVRPGDVINITSRPPQFFYIGGQINSPGQKDFHAGLTLTQAVLASGGVTRFTNNKIRVSRQGPDGRLISTEYNLKEIEAGKVPDPPLQAGDRIEVGRKD